MRLFMRVFLRMAAVLLALPAALLAPASASASADSPKAPPAPAVVPGDWLQANLEAKDLVLLDGRPLKDFLVSHLPGARSVVSDNLRGTSGGVPATTHPAELLATILARAGVTRDAHVVAYGAESDVDATYVAVAARIAGAARVSVLDGGFARWTAEGRPATKERKLAPVAKPDLPGDTSPLVSIEEMKKRVGDGKTVFLDVRSEELWRAGHVPGAKNRFWKTDVAGSSFRPANEIRAEMEAAGVSWERPVVVYCNSGHQASEGFYLLKYVLGHPDVKLYPGSWLEWSMHSDTPRESSPPAGPK